MIDATVALDLQHIWHPSAQMKDYEQFQPLHIVKARGCWLECADGHHLIDAIASWWCKSLGHNHPVLKQALLTQLEKFEHVILANTTHEAIATLGHELAQLSPSLTRSFFASDGSSAVEIAMKLALHAQQIKGQTQRTRFISLEHAYHGETAAALSVSHTPKYRDPYKALLFDPVILRGLPTVSGTHDPLWHHCPEHWAAIEEQLAPYQNSACAIIVEPIVQGAGGLRIYSQSLLRKLRQWADAFGVYLIADEIMTGLGRTGKMLACQHANIEPDLVCLSKALTSGWLPLSAVLATESIYQLFYDDYSRHNTFWHSHTYSGNALAAAVACATLRLKREQNITAQANQLGQDMWQSMQRISAATGLVHNLRGIGAMVAADLTNPQQKPRLGYLVYQEAVKRGVLLRCLGDTVYWLPPLIMDHATLRELEQITQQAIVSAGA